ncbi:MAG: ECF-type sigma factor [Pirellulaceae bacterium]
MTVDPGSITQWLHKLQAGDPEAAHQLWNRYYPKLVQTASRYLRGSTDPAIEGEDVAQSAFQNFYRSALSGEYLEVGNREELWKLLVIFAIKRIKRYRSAEESQVRTLVSSVSQEDGVPLSIADLRTPEAEAQMADLLEHLLKLLDREDPSGELRRIGVLYLEDRAPREIARLLQRRTTTILQKLRLITILWEKCEEL